MRSTHQMKKEKKLSLAGCCVLLVLLKLLFLGHLAEEDAVGVVEAQSWEVTQGIRELQPVHRHGDCPVRRPTTIVLMRTSRALQGCPLLANRWGSR
jgi:hypothetical protein